MRAQIVAQPARKLNVLPRMGDEEFGWHGGLHNGHNRINRTNPPACPLGGSCPLSSFYRAARVNSLRSN
jgi:hypothetical protein